jgi:hypothetical protein
MRRQGASPARIDSGLAEVRLVMTRCAWALQRTITREGRRWSRRPLDDAALSDMARDRWLPSVEMVVRLVGMRSCGQDINQSCRRVSRAVVPFNRHHREVEEQRVLTPRSPARRRAGSCPASGGGPPVSGASLLARLLARNRGATSGQRNDGPRGSAPRIARTFDELLRVGTSAGWAYPSTGFHAVDDFLH